MFDTLFFFSNTLLFCKVCLYYSVTCPLNTAWAIHLSAGRVSQTRQQEFTNSVRCILPQRQILLTLCLLRLQGQSCMNLTKATLSRAPTGLSWLSSGQLHLPPATVSSGKGASISSAARVQREQRHYEGQIFTFPSIAYTREQWIWALYPLFRRQTDDPTGGMNSYNPSHTHIC